MDVTQKMKKAAMTKDEVAVLIDLIQTNPIITSKETNATTNKSKDEAWNSLAQAFNARSGSVPRTKEQLKLKWDNLKKAARKRSQQVRMNNLKTGGGKSDFIPPDEALEKVAGLLGSTCTGFDVSFGGDGIPSVSLVPDLGDVMDVGIEIINEELPATSASPTITENKVIVETPHRGVDKKQPHYFFGRPIAMPLSQNKKGKKNAQTEVQASTITRNLSIASYYEKKMEKLQLEIQLLKLQLDKENNK